MKLVRLSLKNFRGYRDSGWIDLGSLTAFIGENDAGKSTILDALDIFFNGKDAESPFSPDDVNKRAPVSSVVEIRCVFSLEGIRLSNWSDGIVEPGAVSLLNEDGMLEIAKQFSFDESNPLPETVFLRTVRIEVPVGTRNKSLLACSRDDLLKARTALKVRTSSRKDSLLRLALFRHCSKGKTSTLAFDDLAVGKGKEVSSDLWNAIRKILPSYCLFRADRENSDSESEVQDPIRQVVKNYLEKPEMQKRLSAIAASVKKELAPVVASTGRLVKEVDSHAISDLSPRIPEISASRWADVFRGVVLTGDDGIPLSRRGSGVKRLVLVGFFRAKAESDKTKSENVIYAIEEPETGQHFNHQRDLAKSFSKLSKKPNIQVLLTTHSPVFVSQLSREVVMMVSKTDGEVRAEKILGCVLPYPSMNEVNYLAFKECREGYLDELYGRVETIGGNAKHALFYPQSPYKTKSWFNTKKGLPEPFSIAYYIRNYIHHPENTQNTRPTNEEWEEAIKHLRFLVSSASSKQTSRT